MSLRLPVQVAVLAMATMGACVKIEKFTFRDAGGGGGDGDAGDGGTGADFGARAYMTGSHVTAELPGLYKLEFGELGYHYPDALTIGTSQVLSPTTASCSSELGVGVSFYPAGVVNATEQTQLAATKKSIVIEVPGPGVAKVLLDWEADFTSGTCSASPRGRTAFTFFPDGRVQRMDLAGISAPAMASACGCAGGTQWENATFYTFQDSMVAGLTGVTRPATDGASTFATDSICFHNPGAESPYQIAIDYKVARFRRMRRVGSNLAVIGDMIDQGISTLSAAGDGSTVMLIDNDSNCTELDTRITPYRDDVRVAINGTDEGLGMDGLYGGAHDGAPDRRGVYIPGTSGTTITLGVGSTGDVPSFGLRLDLSDFAGIASVSRDWASNVTQWYTQQEVRTPSGDPTGMWILWFAEGLTGTRTITIEAIAK